MDICKPNENQDFYNQISEILLNESKKVIINVFERLSDDELALYEQFFDLSESGKFKDMNKKLQPVMDKFATDLQAKFMALAEKYFPLD